MYYFKTFAEETLNILNNCVESAKVRFVVMMKDGTLNIMVIHFFLQFSR